MSLVAVLLSTYNGEKYLKEQLDSLLFQTYQNFEIIVRDDGSADDTLVILSQYKNIKVLKSNKNIGVKKSFSSLLEYAQKNTQNMYFMFCDQDDVWEKDKIANTLARMQALENDFGIIPLLVHTDLEVVDDNLHRINTSFMKYQNLDVEKNNFNDLLLQNTITGCTAMINRSLASLVLPISSKCIMHDWWIGLVASKFGMIVYIDVPTIKYRQHTNNSIGTKGFTLNYLLDKSKDTSLIAKNISQAKSFLQRYKNDLDAKSVAMLEDFISIESQSFWKKRKILFKHKLLKQGLLRNLGLMLKI